MRAPTAEDQLAGLTKGGVVVSDQGLQQDQIDQVPEPFVLLTGPWRKGHAVQLLRHVKPKSQARQLGRAGDSEGVGKSDRVHPFTSDSPEHLRDDRGSCRATASVP